MRQREELQIVSLAAESLHDVVSDVLDFSKIESEGLAIGVQAYDLHGLLLTTIAVLNSQARAKHLALECRVEPSVPSWALGDSRHLRQVLVNLLGNAIKFTDEGRVVLNASASEGRLFLTVEDTGIGISEDAQKRVFDPFAQADDTITRRFGGTGLGLTISKQFVEAMGGTLSLRSTVGKGTCFSVSIPLTATEPKHAAREHSLGFALVGLRSQFAERIEGLLSRWGFEYTVIAPTELPGCAQNPSLKGIVVEGGTDSALESIAIATSQEQSGRPISLALVVPEGTAPIHTKSTTQGWNLISSDASDEVIYSALLHGTSERVPAVAPKQTQKVKGRVLVVDDNEVNSQILKACLERAGWSVRQAASFDDACTALSEEVFSVAMFDMHMPEATGFDLLEEAQNMLAGGPLPGFVLCTADARVELHDEAAKLGFDAVILKPITEQTVRTVTNNVARNLSGRTVAVVPLELSVSASSVQVEDFLDPARLSELRRMTPDFERFWGRITRDFIRDTDILINRLSEPATSSNIQVWKDTIHAIKGNSINLGGHALHDACTEAYALSRDEVLAEGSRVSREIRALYDATKQALHAAVDLAA
jgi:two-component system sensor histidine kinase RpfC